MISDKTVENVALRKQLADAIAKQNRANAEAEHARLELQQTVKKQKADAEAQLDRYLREQRAKCADAPVHVSLLCPLPPCAPKPTARDPRTTVTPVRA